MDEVELTVVVRTMVALSGVPMRCTACQYDAWQGASEEAHLAYDALKTHRDRQKAQCGESKRRVPCWVLTMSKVTRQHTHGSRCGGAGLLDMDSHGNMTACEVSSNGGSNGAQYLHDAR